MTTPQLPTFADVQSAADRLQGIAHRTPVLTSSTLNQQLGAEVFFKCENLQRIGAFKFRGAYNALSRLTPEQRRRGVVAFSSGNHAQAVALSGRLLDTPITVVMPADAPQIKQNATRGYGATVVLYDRLREDRQVVADALIQEKGLTLVPPFDHPHVIAGQGTAAKELLEDTGPLDMLFCPLGGGGLLAGTLLSVEALSPDCAAYGVEPLAGNDGQQSIETGSIVSIAPPTSIADGALSLALGQLTFPILQRVARGVLTVTDEELVQVMRWFGERMKLIVEPTGCLGAAGMLQNPDLVRGKRVGVILSGGNIDLSRYGELLAG